MASANRNGKVGIYEAATGTSDLQDRATWNYDWHVDLRDAHGVAAGTTLLDYDLTLETDAFDSQFGFPVPLDLKFGGFIPDNTVLYQSSQNPVFGGTDFDPFVGRKLYSFLYDLDFVDIDVKVEMYKSIFGSRFSLKSLLKRVICTITH